MFYVLSSENIPIFKTDRLITCQMSRLRTLQFSFRSDAGRMRTDCNRWTMSYLHTETHSWPRLCPALRCWDTAHRTADPPCPDMYQGDTGRTAPAPRCRTCPQRSSLRRRTQVSGADEHLASQRTAGRQQKNLPHFPSWSTCPVLQVSALSGTLDGFWATSYSVPENWM